MQPNWWGGGRGRDGNQSEGVSPERDIWSLSVVACRWLWGMALVGSSSSPSASFLDSSGWHSDQGSQNPGIAWEFRLWEMVCSFIARHFAENFDARLAGIVIWSDCPLFEKKNQEGLKSMKIDELHNIRAQKIRGAIFKKKQNDMWWNDTSCPLRFKIWWNNLNMHLIYL